jgi:hypothetical protein
MARAGGASELRCRWPALAVALAVAAQRGDVARVTALLGGGGVRGGGADQRAVNDALRMAACNDHVATVQVLLAAKAHADSHVPCTRFAVVGGATCAFALLLHVAPPRQCREHTDLMDVILRKDDAGLLRVLLSAKASPFHMSGSACGEPYHGRCKKPPLAQARLYNSVDTAALLLEAKADPNIEAETRGMSCTAAAADQGQVALLEVLLRAKAHVEGCAKAHVDGCAKAHVDGCGGNEENSEQTPVWRAVKSKQVRTLRVLLKAKARVNVHGYDRTLLAWACLSGPVATVDLLLRARADVNALDHKGRTALAQATQRGNDTVVRRLLAAKACA